MGVEVDMQKRIDPKTTLGAVILGVSNLEKMTQFYKTALGLDLLVEESERTTLGVSERPLVILEHRPRGKAFLNSPGLFHLAILVPTRKDLANWLQHFTKSGFRLDGVGDHIVSEALYLSDPEGNGIEVYQDRPKEDWQYIDGKLVMDTLPVDLYSLLQEADESDFAGMPAETKVGHIHLQVNDLEKSREFYSSVVGFDIVAGLPSASFLSAGGYHHHVGMNVWRSRGASPRPNDALGLIAYQLILPGEDALNTHLSKMQKRGAGIFYHGNIAHLTDPAGNVIQFRNGA